MNDKVLEVKKLQKNYGNSIGIKNVSFSLNKGEIYGFIGPNGSGKSTTIRTILAIINKNSGTVLFKGKELDRDDIISKEKIGYLPSEINLYGEMLVSELFNYHESFYKKNINKRRKQLVNLLKIDESKKIENLSLGNLKKVGIVLSLMHSPELLILDEPTSGLDPIMQKVFYDILLEEKEKGTTILYSSHILTEIEHVCDRIGFIKDGEIIKEFKSVDFSKNNFLYVTIGSKDVDNIEKDLKLEVKNKNNSEITFINNMDINDLLRAISKYNIDKLLIQNIPLEDLFESFYK